MYVTLEAGDYCIQSDGKHDIVSAHSTGQVSAEISDVMKRASLHSLILADTYIFP